MRSKVLEYIAFVIVGNGSSVVEDILLGFARGVYMFCCFFRDMRLIGKDRVVCGFRSGW